LCGRRLRGVPPFPDDAFDLCLCTQAFYFLPDPESAIREFERVLRPGGRVVLTLPVVYPGTERLYTGLQLRELFADWEDVVVIENGGTIVSTVTLSAYFLHQLAKRVPHPLRAAFVPLYAALNLAGEGLDLVERRLPPSSARLPANLLLRATRAARGG
jgi:SAM-dependent methyltransferase